MAGDYVVRYEGVTEERAHEISLATARQVIAQNFDEAQSVIQARLDALENRTIRQLDQAEQLDAFADPAFIRSYRKAQEGAAASEREVDYDMLAALLTERTESPNDRKVTAAIDRAIETVDSIHDDALRGITILEAVRLLGPLAGQIDMGIDSMELMMNQFVDGPFPEGDDWLDHLDILDVVRVDTSGNLRSFDDFYSERLIGYVAPGCREVSAPKTIGGPYSDRGWGDLVIPHEGRPGYVRIAAVTEDALRRMMDQSGLDADLADAIVAAAKRGFGFGQEDPEAREALVRALRKRPTLGQIAFWWNQIPHYVQVTAVGRMLARANMIRLDAAGSLPPLD